MTWREIIYMIQDLTKSSPDDSIFNEDHIKFLCSKYRNYILNNQYNTVKRSIPDANYQTICVDLTQIPCETSCDGTMLKSTVKVPYFMSIGEKQFYPPVGLSCTPSQITYVSSERFPYIGNDKYFKKIIYATIGPDHYLYLKSASTEFQYLQSLQIRGLFDDIITASEMKCDVCGRCELYDIEFPLEAAWVNTLINLVVQDVTKGMYQLRDTKNDSQDSTDDLAQSIQRFTNTQFRNLMKGNQNNNDV